MVDLLQKNGLANHRVHWHCFTGSPDMAAQILGKFPNAKLSLSNRSLAEDHMTQVIRQTPLELIVLETDAPYLDCFQQRLNTSWSLPGHAQQIAGIHNIPLEILLLVVHNNLQELYQLPTSPPFPNDPCDPKGLLRLFSGGEMCTIQYV